MPQLPISFSAGSLPEGWEGTPDELLQMLVELLEGEVEGDFPAGQLGGSRPTEDVGVWYNLTDYEIELWNGTKYLPARTVPVGTTIDWAAAPSTPVPANYLECDGSLLQREDYPELYDFLRTQWGTPPNSDTFYLPHCSGRVAYGAGTGEYAPEGSGISSSLAGNMQERSVGEYFGREAWHPVDTPTGAPSDLKWIAGGISNFVDRKKRIVSVLAPGYAVRKLIRYR